MVKAVFFDWFNTLACYDPPREELHSKLMRDFGIEASPRDLLRGLMAADKYFFAEAAHSPWNKKTPEEQARFYLRYGEIMFSVAGLNLDKKLIPRIIGRWPELRSQMHFVLYKDVLSTLGVLKERNLILGLLTNATRETVAVQEKLGLKPYLEFVVTSEEAGADKPDPKIFLMALERAGVKAADAMHVGDQYDIDIAGARGAGIKPIMIDRYDLYPEVKDCPRIHTLPELKEYLF